MVMLKNKVNKTAVMKYLRKEAEKMYEDAYEGELRIKDFMSGADMLFDLLRLSDAKQKVCPHCHREFDKTEVPSGIFL